MKSPTAQCQGGPRNPIIRLIAYFVAWKLLLLGVALLSPGPGYDTSTGLLQYMDASSPNHRCSTNYLGPLAGKLVRWDGIYYTQIARRGYSFEQEWAFGWGHTRALSLVSRRAAGSSMAAIDAIAATGIIIAHACHLFSVLAMYQLTLSVWSEVAFQKLRNFAFLSATLHIISPAGLFLSAPYAESPFALLNFAGLYFYSQSYRQHLLKPTLLSACLMLSSGCTFGVATMFRGNGLLSGTVFVYDALETLSVLLRTISTSITHCEVANAVQRLAITGLSGLLMACIALFPQYVAYTELCLEAPSNMTRRPWCDSTIPSIYAWVQKEYWGVGFLRYWTISNQPLFLIATPMLIVIYLSGKWAWEGEHTRTRLTRVVDTEHEGGLTIQCDTIRGSPLDHAILRRFAVSQIILGLLAFTTYHVQIITRLSSGYPVWYWWLASLIISGNDANLWGWRFNIPRWITRWMVVYAFIQGALFASFLPPA
ncbi:MAG: hypothetical protein Q9163_005067 [Psora crenata]